MSTLLSTMLFLLHTAFFILSNAKLTLRMHKKLSTNLLNVNMLWCMHENYVVAGYKKKLNTVDSKQGTEVKSEHR